MRSEIVLEVISKMGGTYGEYFQSTRGSKDVAFRRQVAMTLRAENHTLTSVGKTFGRYRTTIRSAIAKVQARRDNDAIFNLLYKEMRDATRDAI